MDRSSRRLIVSTFLSVHIVSGGCASSGAMPRPSPFPTLPAPPAAMTPTPIEPARLGTPAELVRTAYTLQGVRYHLGGASPLDGFDCSGFVRYVFSVNHRPLPRTVQEQYAFGSSVAGKDVREGDLVFFSTIAPGPSHVGIAVDAGLFIHAPGANGAVRVERLDAPYWHDRMVGVRRVL